MLFTGATYHSALIKTKINNTHQNSDNAQHHTSHVVLQLPVRQRAVQAVERIPRCQLKCAKTQRKEKNQKSLSGFLSLVPYHNNFISENFTFWRDLDQDVIVSIYPTEARLSWKKCLLKKLIPWADSTLDKQGWKLQKCAGVNNANTHVAMKALYRSYCGGTAVIIIAVKRPRHYLWHLQKRILIQPVLFFYNLNLFDLNI